MRHARREFADRANVCERCPPVLRAKRPIRVLHYVRDRTGGERGGLQVSLEVVTGQDDDRYSRGRGITVELFHRRPAVDLWHVQVHHDHVGPEPTRRGHGFLSVRHDLDVVARHVEVEAVHLASIAVVVGEQDERPRDGSLPRSRLPFRHVLPAAKGKVGQREKRNTRAMSVSLRISGTLRKAKRRCRYPMYANVFPYVVRQFVVRSARVSSFGTANRPAWTSRMPGSGPCRSSRKLFG